MIEQTFEDLPAELASWARAARRPTLPTGLSPLCSGAASESARPSVALRIAHPRDGARYVVDGHRPRDEQRLVVRIEGRGPVSLRVDGRPVAAPAVDGHVEWPLEPGAHELVAVTAEGARSAPVRVRVE